MLNISVKNGKAGLHISGTIEDIFADTIVAIAAVYGAIRESDPKDAEDFERVLKLALEDDEVSPFANRFEDGLIRDDLVDLINDEIAKGE